MKFVWPPLINAISERQRRIADGLNAANYRILKHGKRKTLMVLPSLHMLTRHNFYFNWVYT